MAGADRPASPGKILGLRFEDQPTGRQRMRREPWDVCARRVNYGFSLPSEKLGIEDGADLQNGSGSVANLDREFLIDRSFHDRVTGGIDKGAGSATRVLITDRGHGSGGDSESVRL